MERRKFIERASLATALTAIYPFRRRRSRREKAYSSVS
jgi:hypothetical protein